MSIPTILQNNLNLPQDYAGLLSSIRKSDLTTIKLYCKTPFIHQSDKTGVTPLMLTAKLGNTRAMQILLEEKVNPLCIDDEGLSAWDYLAQPKHFPFGRKDFAAPPKVIIKEQLLRKAAAFFKVSPKLYEIGREKVRLWIQTHKPIDDLEAPPTLQKRHVYQWAQNRLSASHELSLDLTFQEVLKILDFLNKIYPRELLQRLDNGDDLLNPSLISAINIIESFQHMGTTRHTRGSPTMVKLLLKAKADTRTTQNNMTPLMWSAYCGQKECLELLLDTGASVNAANDKGDTALMKAAECEANLPILQLLIERNADIKARNKEKQTALFFARSCSMVTFLLQCKADVRDQDETGSTVLMQATLRDDINIINPLLLAGSPLETADHNGDTALSQAARRSTWDGRIETIKRLLEAGALLETRNKQGNTPLIEAALEGNPDIAQVFVDAKANLYARNFTGQTAREVALEKKHNKFAKYLHTAGLKPTEISAKHRLHHILNE